MINELDDGRELPDHLKDIVVTPQERYKFFEALHAERHMEYRFRRQAEYPPITDYIDGVVKGDQAQIDAYIAACRAVKSKYPKPE